MLLLIINLWEVPLLTYSGVESNLLYDNDIGAMNPGITLNDYIIVLGVSMIGWLAFTILLLIFGIIRFQRREIK